jgi:hypothetical protein
MNYSYFDIVNTGVLVDKKPRLQDYMAGGETGIQFVVRLPNGNWFTFKPTDEKQHYKYFDTMACVTFSALNCVEYQVNYLISSKQLSVEQMTKLNELGFIDANGKFNCSDRFTAYMSGTTKSGNYMWKVWESIRIDGLLPESDWSYPIDQDSPIFDWNEYYKDPGQARKDKAKLILEILQIKWEWLWQGATETTDTIREQASLHLQQAPIHIAAPVCPPWSGPEIIQPCGLTQAGHATAIYGIEQLNEVFTSFLDLDHYVPYNKRLAPNYCIPYAIKGVVTPMKVEPLAYPDPMTFHHTFATDMVYKQSSPEIAALQMALKIDGCFPEKVLCTGNYLEITRQAVKKFQIKYKVASWWELITVNGRRVGPKTRQALNILFK